VLRSEVFFQSGIFTNEALKRLKIHLLCQKCPTLEGRYLWKYECYRDYIPTPVKSGKSKYKHSKKLAHMLPDQFPMEVAHTLVCDDDVIVRRQLKLNSHIFQVITQDNDSQILCTMLASIFVQLLTAMLLRKIFNM